MSHLTRFGIENFRVFGKETWFDFAPITVLTGTNSSGKSSVIKSLLLIKENFKAKGYQLNALEEIEFNNKINLGGFTKVATDNKKPIIYKFNYNFLQIDHTSFTVELHYKKNDHTAFDEAVLVAVIFKNLVGEELINYRMEDGNQIVEYSLLTLLNLIKKQRELWNAYYKKFAAELEYGCESQTFREWVCNVVKARNEDTWLCDIKPNLEGGSVLGQNLHFNDNIKFNDELLRITYPDEVDGNLYMAEKIDGCIFNYQFFNYEIEELEGAIKANKIIVKLSKGDSKKIEEFEFIEVELNEYKIQYLNDVIELKKVFREKGLNYDQSIEKLRVVENDFFSEKIKIWLSKKSNISASNSKFDVKSLTHLVSSVHNNGFERTSEIKSVDDKLLISIEEFLKSNINKYNYNNTKVHSFDNHRIEKKYNKFFNIEYDSLFYLINRLLDSFLATNDFEIGIANEVEFLSVNRVQSERLYLFDNKNEHILSSHIHELVKNDTLGNEICKSFLAKWIQEFNIAQSIDITLENEQLGAYVNLTLKDGRKATLMEIGFGYSHILPILLKIINVAFKNVRQINTGNVDSRDNPNFEPSILAIEEPEANMHPALQSKLADMFVDAYRTFDMQFVLESHSEYLVRRLQYLTAKKELKQEESIIHYFYHPDAVPPGEQQTYPIKINEDGSLTKNFGTGFFDEADNIALELFLLKQEQKN